METFVALGPVADIVSDVVVFGLDVVFQMAFAKKGLIAALLRAGEGTVVGMRAFVFLEADRAGVRLRAAFKVAGVFVFARLGLCLGQFGCRGLSRGPRCRGGRCDRGGIVLVLFEVGLLAGIW